MLIPPRPHSRLRGVRTELARVIVLATALAAGAVHAAPEASSDAALRALTDTGTLERGATPEGAGTAEIPAVAAPSLQPSSRLGGPASPAPERLLERVRDRATDMVLTALNFVGVRYQRGGDSEAGFDCSGFTRFVFGSSLGLILPRRADEQAHARGLVPVQRQDLQPGDLVFFNTLKRTFSHVGIYIGGNRFIHAPRPGGEVRTEDMSFAYWQSRYTGARRVDSSIAELPPELVGAPAAAESR